MGAPRTSIWLLPSRSNSALIRELETPDIRCGEVRAMSGDGVLASFFDIL